MTKHMTGTRKEWLAARLELLEAEKELTRRSDELVRRRQPPDGNLATHGFRACYASSRVSIHRRPGYWPR